MAPASKRSASASAAPTNPDPQDQPAQQATANPGTPMQPQPPPRPVLLQLANINPFTTLSDLTTENGRRLWRQATEPLPDPFDGSHQHFQVFTANITTRFRMCNWFRFISFPVDGIDRDLITNPTMISLPQVQQAREQRQFRLNTQLDPLVALPHTIELFNKAVIAHLHCTMMYHFLYNSISTPLKTYISQKVMSGLVHEDGPILLKLIQEKVKGRANKQAVLNARSALQTLNLKEFKFNIKKLHDHVNSQVLIINSNGGTVQGDGITAALLTTYKTCTNEDFLHHIRHLEAQANDTDTDMNFDDLMVQAETKYDTLCQTKVWGKKDPRDETILALQAKVNKLEGNNKATPSSGSSKDKSTPASLSNKTKRRYPDWRYEKPKDNKKKLSKTIKGKSVDFWWCDVLNMWARHKPNECKAKANEKDGNSNSNASSSGSSNQNNTNRPRLQAQAAAVLSSDDEASSQE